MPKTPALKKNSLLKKTSVAPKRVIRKPLIAAQKKTDVNQVLVENFIALQKVMTNLSMKFDELSSQISKLLELFEISAKTLAQKDPHSEFMGGGNKELMEKLDNLIDQNKTIARGLALMHEMNPEKVQKEPIQGKPQGRVSMQRSPVQERIQGQMQTRTSGQNPVSEMNKYQRSMSSGNEIQKP